MDEKIKPFLAAFCGIFTVLSESYGAICSICCTLILLDLLTGLSKAKIQGRLNSDTGYKGFWRKAALLAALAFGICLDLLMEYAAAAGLGAKFPALIGRLLAFYIAVNECISIAENLSACGVQLPHFITKVLDAAQKKFQEPKE
jgi:toxin secretion/phage lysis holin